MNFNFLYKANGFEEIEFFSLNLQLSVACLQTRYLWKIKYAHDIIENQNAI